MTEEQIKHMANRFLGWKLPDNFIPDNGISFAPEFNVEHNAKYGRPPQRHEPSGTNLFNYTQAEAMVRHMVEGLQSTEASTQCPDEDWFEEIISDSLEMDWRPRDAARAIVRHWESRWYPKGDHLSEQGEG